MTPTAPLNALKDGETVASGVLPNDDHPVPRGRCDRLRHPRRCDPPCLPFLFLCTHLHWSCVALDAEWRPHTVLLRLGAELIEWYIASGCTGLFAVCQSSEMYHMSNEDRLALAKHVVDQAAKRVRALFAPKSSHRPKNERRRGPGPNGVRAASPVALTVAVLCDVCSRGLIDKRDTLKRAWRECGGSVETVGPSASPWPVSARSTLWRCPTPPTLTPAPVSVHVLNATSIKEKHTNPAANHERMGLSLCERRL